MTLTNGLNTSSRPGAPSRVIQGFFAGGRPKIIQPSVAAAAPVRAQVPSPVQVRPISPPTPIVPGRSAAGALQPALRPGHPPRPIVPTPVRPAALQPARPHQPQLPQPILPRAEGSATVQPQVGNAFALPSNFTLKPHGSGQPLPEPIQKKMESFFNTSFADVRVHVGHEASAIGALAFTHGTDLYFAPGQYNPQSTQGQQLLGHELTHVVQQRAGRVRNPLGAGVAVVQDPALEAEADRMGMRAASTHVPIQAKPASVASPVASLPGAVSRPTTVAANSAISPARSPANVAVQRTPGPTIPGKTPSPGRGSPDTISTRNVAQPHKKGWFFDGWWSSFAFHMEITPEYGVLTQTSDLMFMPYHGRMYMEYWPDQAIEPLTVELHYDVRTGRPKFKPRALKKDKELSKLPGNSWSYRVPTSTVLHALRVAYEMEKQVNAGAITLGQGFFGTIDSSWRDATPQDPAEMSCKDLTDAVLIEVGVLWARPRIIFGLNNPNDMMPPIHQYVGEGLEFVGEQLAREPSSGGRGIPARYM